MKAKLLLLLLTLTISVFGQQTDIKDPNFEDALILLGLDDVIDGHVATENIESVTTLDVSRQNIVSLEGISDFSSLEDLNCSYNSIKLLDLGEGSELKKLNCSNNKLTELYGIVWDSEIEVINISNNQLVYLNTEEYDELKVLICFNNKLPNLNLAYNRKMEVLICNNNELSQINLRNGNNEIINSFNSKNNTDLSCIFVDDNTVDLSTWEKDEISHFVDDNESCEVYTYTSIPDVNFENKLINLGIDYEQDGRVLINDVSKIETLNIQNSDISDLTGIEYFKSLKTLNCNSNNITSLNLKDFKELKYLYCTSNQITELDLSTNSKIVSFNCDDNEIQSISLPNSTTLYEINASGNNLNSLDFSGTPMLTRINVNTNYIKSLDVSSLANLTDLICWENELTTLTFGKNKKVTSISLNNNKVQNLDLSGLPLLKTLYARDNNLTDLDISSCLLLEDVYINNNQITSLNTFNNIALEKVICNNNKLTSLDFLENIRIKEINCEDNELNFVDLRIIPNDVQFSSINNTSLTCIYVKNPSSAKNSWKIVDSHTRFVKDETECSNPISEITEIEPNNDEDNANLIDANSKVTASIGNGDTYDYYKLDITENGFISISTDDFILPEYGLTFFYSATIDGVALWSDYQPISKGIYYIRFVSDESDPEKQYSFRVSFTPELRPIDNVDNNSFETAQEISLTELNTEMLGYQVNGEQDVDYYKFVAPKNGRLELSDTFIEKTPYKIDVFNNNKENIDFGHIEDSNNEREMVIPVSFYPTYVGAIHYIIFEEGETYYIVVSDYMQSFAGEYKMKARFIEEPIADFDYTIDGDTFFFNYLPKSDDEKSITWHYKKVDQDYYGSKFSSKGNPQYKFHENGVYDVMFSIVSKGGENNIEKQIVVGDNIEVYPKEIGNNGKATLKLFNVSESNISNISFTNGSSTIEAKRISDIDNNIIETVFFLEDETLGKWKLNITDNNGVITIIDDALEIIDKQNSEPGALSMWPIQNNTYLPNRWQDFTIKYKNTGGLDLVNQQIWISISDPTKTEVKLGGDKKIVYPSYVYENNLQAKFDSIPPYVDVDNFLGEDVPTRIYPLYIPLIKKGESGALKFKLKSSASDRVIVNIWTYDQESDNNGLGKTLGTPCAQQLLEKIATEVAEAAIPGVACAVSVGGEMGNLSGDEDRSVGSVVYSWASIAVNCGSLAFGPASGIINSTWVVVSNILDFSIIGSNCYDKKHRKSNESTGVGSSDPNSIVGPFGGGGEEHNYMQSENVAYYIVNFENKSTATAPAQEIWIHDTLDITKFDMSKFSFGDIVIGDSIFEIADGRRSFIKEVDLRPAQDILGRIIGKANDQGIIEVYFRSLSPSTLDDNTNPELGILPPNNSSPEGEGSISYFVGLINPENGVIYQNKATIIFDYNDAITTNTWINTIDNDLPNSSITSHDFDTEKIEITLNIDGSDALSGVNDYIVFASHNGEAYTAIGRTPNNSITYKFPTNGEYKFFSLATDKAYNIEQYKTTSEVSLIIDQLSIDNFEFNNLFKIYPNPTSSVFKIESKYEVIDVSVYNASGVRVKYFKGNNITDYDIDNLRSGLYMISINTDRGIANKKIIIR